MLTCGPINLVLPHGQPTPQTAHDPQERQESQKNDLIPQVQDIITVGEFYEIAAGGQIIFT